MQLDLRQVRGLSIREYGQTVLSGELAALDRTLDDLFVDLVERTLRADGRDVEVLNGGTEGYSTDQELVWLRSQGLALQPDVVVLCFYQNDVYWCGQGSYAGLPKPRFRC